MAACRHYRAAFALDATVSQIARVAEWANNLFPYTNVDIIYGIAGQDVDDVLSDADRAIELGTTSIDFYPLNNLSAQIRMHRALDSAGMQRPTAAQRLNHRRMLREHMLSRNYARINGYGYARRRGRSNDMIERKPKFLYHDILYGYSNDAVIGYGASAVTQIPGYNMYNAASRTHYREILVNQSSLPCTAYRTAGSPGKGVVTFPYRGSLVKSMVPWESVSSEVLASLDELLRAGLMTETNTAFEVSETGWLYYVNMMYCLMPSDDKRWISEQIGLFQHTHFRRLILPVNRMDLYLTAVAALVSGKSEGCFNDRSAWCHTVPSRRRRKELLPEVRVYTPKPRLRRGFFQRSTLGLLPGT